MLPTLPINSKIQVKPDPYQKISEIKRGDVITENRVVNGSRTTSIKRVIGLPGDKIAMSGATLKINGRALPHSQLSKTGKVTVYLETNGAAQYPVQYGDNLSPAAPFSGVVSPGQLFCVGDNRDNSHDSRHLGGVFFGSIVGKKVP